jgi:hypothetical protein
LDGAGGIGDSIGTTDMQPLTMAGITPGATRFTTGAVLLEAAVELQATTPSHRPGLSTETPRLLEDTLHLAARAVFARVPSATTGMADKQRASRHAAALA